MKTSAATGSLLVLVGMLGVASAGQTASEESPGPSLKPTRYRALPFDPAAVKGLSEAGLSAKAGDLLVKNGFVVVGPSRGDISQCYEGKFPPFVTLDCVLEIFLADFEIAWGELEDKQARSLAALQAELWDALVARFDRLPKAARGAGTRLLGLIAVGRSLADPKWKIPNKLPEGADAALLRAAWQSDLDAVLRGAGGGRSALWKREIDWAVFKPIGVYDASPERRQFYRLSQWWGFQGLRGDDRARDLTLAAEKEEHPRKVLETQLLKLRESFAKEEDESSLLGFQGSVRRLVCELAKPRPDPRAPLFVHTPAYRDRCMAAALATWAGTREVYAPRVAVFGGSGGMEEPLRGLVDPNLDAWQRLVELCHATEVAFQKAGVRFSPKSRHWALKYRRIAEKQLRGEPLTRGEGFEFLQFGNALHNAIDTHAEQTESDPMGTLDRRVAVAFARSRTPDLLRYAGKACSPCWAIVEYGGRLQLCVGGVFDYVEFDLPPGEALPRAEFRKLMDSPNAPPFPDWTNGYRAER